MYTGNTQRVVVPITLYNLARLQASEFFCAAFAITNDEIHSILIVSLNDFLERDLKIHSSTAFYFVRSSSSAVRPFTFFV